MTAPQHLTITGPEDILGYVPHSLGYWPSRSLVAMTMQGKRLGATLRVDLPGGCASRRGREDFARTVAEYLLADDDADGTLLMFFTDDGWAADVPPEESGPGGVGRPLLATLKPPLDSPECRCGTPGTSATSTGATPTALTPAAARCRAVPSPRSGTAASTPRWCSWAAASGPPPGAAPAEDHSGRRRRIRPWWPRRQRWAGELAAGGPAGPSSRGCWTHGSGAGRRIRHPGLSDEVAGFLRACPGCSVVA